MRTRRLGLTLAAWLALATGGAALARVEPPVLPAKGTVQAVFTPDDDAEGLLADAIDQAREQVLVQAYLLSNKVITRALLDAHGRGIDVRVLADREQMMRSGGSRVPELAGAGRAGLAGGALQERAQQGHRDRSTRVASGAGDRQLQLHADGAAR
ncbi:hypothetical protein ACEQUB_02519 [Ralstonia syzygii]